jgi:putative RNA 2'-phosphotransferase
MDVVRASKRMSKALRHKPSAYGLTLDSAGWVPLADFLPAMGMTRADLDTVVSTSDKQRFVVTAGEDGVERIRANQGHSVPVDLGLAPTTPPDQLYHGTSASVLDSIRATGLDRGGRHHVHLSVERETALRVGARRSARVAILAIDAAAMSRDGHVFYRSDNGVWLTDAVPPEYLSEG